MNSERMEFIESVRQDYSKEDLINMDVEDKIKLSSSLMKSVHAVRNYKMAFSGGKDSCVMEWLACLKGINVEKLYNNTTIDPEGTISFCQKHHCTIIRPKETFLQLVEKKGFPTMFKRFCCEKLKERYVADYCFVGVRSMESVKRSKRYTCFEATKMYSKKVASTFFYPLVWFTDADIEYCVNTYQIECHPLYYDYQGKFCVDRRLGCIGCPLQSDRGRLDFLRYPKLLKQIILRGIRFHERQGRTKHDAYLNIVYNLFYSNHGYKKYQQAYEGLFDIDPKEVLEEYFFIDLP